MLEKFEGMGRGLHKNHLYDNLHRVLLEQKELEKEGILEESPMFVTPESESIYDSMLASEEALIDIFIPNLKLDDFRRLQQAFGYTTQWGYSQSEATRIRMFRSDYRKVRFWHTDENGNEYVDENENHWQKAEAHSYLKGYLQGKLGLPVDRYKKGPRFLVHSHEHVGMTYKPAEIGWLTESLLQQRGISYFVNNHTYGKAYIYNPETQHIEFLPEIYEVSRWE